MLDFVVVTAQQWATEVSLTVAHIIQTVQQSGAI